MIIERENELPIKKRLLQVNNLDIYDKDKIEAITPLIDKILEENPVSTFDMITLLRRKYQNSIVDAYYNVSIKELEESRANCLYLSKVLKKELKEYDINAEYLSHQARNFAFKCGDKKIKEVHVSLIYPTIDQDKLVYTIFDPGLKIGQPLTFYAENCLNLDKNNDLKIKVDYDNSDVNYPYAINMFGINPYSYTKVPHLVYQKFNPEYLIENVGEMLFPISYKFLTGYKATIFSKYSDKKAYIKLEHIDKNLEFCDYEVGTIKFLSYLDILRIKRNNLINQLHGICNKLDLDVCEVVDDIYFMIDIDNEFINYIMDQDVKREYQKIRGQR